MSLNDRANIVNVKGHRGPHPRAYHEEVYERLTEETLGCRTTQRCREMLTKELRRLADEIATPNTKLHDWVTREQ